MRGILKGSDRSSEAETTRRTIEQPRAASGTVDEVPSTASREASALLQRLPEAVLRTDAAGRIVEANPAAVRLLGRPQADLVGTAAETLFEDDSAFSVAWRHGIAGRRLSPAVGYELALRTDASVGRRITCELAVSSLWDETGRRLTGALIQLRDISARKEMEFTLHRVDRREGLAESVRQLAHDFNNLLTALSGNLDLARMALTDGDADEAETLLDDAQQAADTSAGLTRQMLNVAKGDAPVAGDVRLPEVIESAVRFALRGSRVSDTVDVADDLWPVSTEASRVTQVLHNLLLNAVQAMPEGGAVRVTARNVRSSDADPITGLAPGPYVRLTVADNGPGIPDERHERIFESRYTTKAEGSGLGLASVATMVRAHGGSVTVHSPAAGGACFTVYLPAGEGSGAASAQEAPPPDLPPGLRALVLDDEPMVRTTLQRMATRLGVQCDVAAEEEQALHLAARAAEAGRPYDLALLDLTLPGGRSSDAILNALRRHSPELKAIVMSGHPLDGDSVEGGGASVSRRFDASLPKPVTLDAMRRVIARLQAGGVPSRHG